MSLLQLVERFILSVSLLFLFFYFTLIPSHFFFFFFNDPAPPEFYPFPQPASLPIWLDLLVPTAHFYPQKAPLKPGPRFREPLLLHRNNRDGTFDEVSKQAGLQDLPLKSRRG